MSGNRNLERNKEKHGNGSQQIMSNDGTVQGIEISFFVGCKESECVLRQLLVRTTARKCLQTCPSAGSRSKNSATNQKRAYGVGTELVRTGYAHIWPGILMGCTPVVRSAYGVGTDCRGVGVTILVQIDVESIFKGVFLLKKNSDFFTPPSSIPGAYFYAVT